MKYNSAKGEYKGARQGYHPPTDIVFAQLKKIDPAFSLKRRLENKAKRHKIHRKHKHGRPV